MIDLKKISSERLIEELTNRGYTKIELIKHD